MSMLAREHRHREERKRRGDPESLVATELDCFRLRALSLRRTSARRSSPSERRRVVAVLLAMTIAHVSSRADVDRLREWAGRIDIMGLSDFTSRA